MFSSLNNLNEGGVTNNLTEVRKRELREGKNPKTSENTSGTEGWHSLNSNSHKNSRWEKLRK